MLVNRRSGFRLGGRNDGLGVMGVGHRSVPPPVRSPFKRIGTGSGRTGGGGHYGLGARQVEDRQF